MPLEIRILGPEWERALAIFFSGVRRPSEAYFHPHPLTDEAANQLAHYRGEDLYYLLVDGGSILAYGMLRGWDEGFEVPSLGIVVSPACRGKGLGELLMKFLHSAARSKGAKKIRLKVYKANLAAYKLYEKLGYQFEERSGEEQLIGILVL